jgi:hypothetical protein
MYASRVSTLDALPRLFTADTAAEWAQIYSTGHDLVMVQAVDEALYFLLPDLQR